MGTVIVRRRPRRPAPPLPDGVLDVPAPPEIPAVVVSRWGQLLSLLPLLAGTVATALLFAQQDGGVSSYVIGGVFGLSSLGMLATNFGSGSGQPRKAEMMAVRRDYLRHLAALRTRVRATADRQRTGLHYRNPDPATLWSTVDSHRLWERRPTDADFGVVRVGLGPQALATELIPPVSRPTEELEPTTARALRNFLDAHAVVPDLPVAVSLRDLSRCYVRGPLEPARALVRAVLAQLAVFHAPGELLIAVVASGDRRPDWDYLKWLPHALHPELLDALGPRRLVAASALELEGLLGELVTNRPRFAPGGEPAAPQLVVVLDSADLSGAQHLIADSGLQGVTLIDLDSPAPRLLDRATLALSVDAAGRLLASSADDATEVGTADQLPLVVAQALARQLAPLRLAPSGDKLDTSHTGELDLADLLGIGDPDRYDVAQGWAPRPNRDRLRVPIGVGGDGYPVELDLKESAQDGMGPHGLLIGATGSGKSELLRTLVLGLAARHDSGSLNFVLVDFKGGATFAPFDRLPHTAAVITNLSDDLALVDRMSDALNGELVRRQELLRRAGNLASLRDYERARAAGAPLAPLPVLVVVCDEFSELLSEKPEFIDTVRTDRPAGPVARGAPAAGLAAAGGGAAARAGHPPVVPDRAAYLLADGVAHGARRRRRLRAAPHAGARVPEVRYRAAGPVQGGLRLRPVPAPRCRWRRGRRRRGGPAGAGVRHLRAGRAEPARAGGAARAGAGRAQPAGAHGGPADRRRYPGAPGVAAAAVDPPALDELLGPLVADPARGLTVAEPGAARRAARPGGPGGQAVRAAPRTAVAGPGRGGRARRGGRRAAQRQVHAAAHAGHRAGADPHPGRGTGLLPGLRRRVAGRAARTAARRRGGRAARHGHRPAHRRRGVALLADRERRFASAGVDVGAPTVPLAPPAVPGRRVRRRVPGRRRLGHPAQRVRGPGAGDRRHRHPGAVLRRPRAWPPPPAGWTSARPSGTCSVPGWSCASATRPTRWSTARPPPTSRRTPRGAASPATGCTS